MKLYGKKIFDWDKINEVKPEERKDLLVDAFSHFIREVNKMPVTGSQLAGQKLAGPDANLMSAIPISLVMSDTIKAPDRGYELLFDEIDMRQSTNNTFDLVGVSGGATFYQQASGEEAKLSKIPTSALTAVSMLRFTGGFNILDDWLRFNQYYKIDQLAADTVRRWYDKRASIFYGLMVALSSGINQAFATDDATTINNACVQILLDLQAAGYVIDENSQFVITCNPALRMRIFKALAASFMAPNTNINQITFNISAVISTTKVANTTYYVSLPGVKSQRGEWEDLNARPPQRNELMLGAAHVWTGGYNGIIGESKQYRRCALS
jgi:hypothetical protein